MTEVESLIWSANGACARHAVVSTSLLLRPRAWIIASASAAIHPLAPILSGLYALLFGRAVVILHNVWVADVRVLVTVLGWVAVASGTMLLLAPEAYGLILRRLPITPQLVALRGLMRLLSQA
ncbi:MAG: hypothetical protein DWI09_10860 [Planctomycetota bacterium]|nr:MAG: hypothetical protein DWI09_10860 [Planctomycetota bacterium]